MSKYLSDYLRYQDSLELIEKLKDVLTPEEYEANVLTVQHRYIAGVLQEYIEKEVMPNEILPS